MLILKFRNEKLFFATSKNEGRILDYLVSLDYIMMYSYSFASCHGYGGLTSFEDARVGEWNENKGKRVEHRA